MNIILLGMPGAGKGTVASWLVDIKKFTHISTGDLLRKEVSAGTKLGKKVQSVMDEGKLVSDDIIIAIIKDFLTGNPTVNKVVFDGFPRTLEQANSLAKIITIDRVIFLEVSEETIIERLKQRTEDGLKRNDDSEEIIRERIRVYYKNTQPLIDLYKEKNILYAIDGGSDVNEVRSLVNSIL